MSNEQEDRSPKLETMLSFLQLLRSIKGEEKDEEKPKPEDYPLGEWNEERKLFEDNYTDPKWMLSFLKKLLPKGGDDRKTTSFKFVGLKYIIWPTVHTAIAEGDVKTLEAILRYPTLAQLFKKVNKLNSVLEVIDEPYGTLDYQGILLFLVREKPLNTRPLHPYLSSKDSVAVFNVLTNYGVLKLIRSMVFVILNDENHILDGIFTQGNVYSYLSHFERRKKVYQQLYVDLYRRAPLGCLSPWEEYDCPVKEDA